MKVIGIIGSPRKGGNTEIVTRHALEAVAAEGIDTEVVRLCELEIKGCNACGVCEKEENCPINDDLLVVYNKMKAADAIILASPV
ncbi:flavodoxin family protein, partial [Chloroflexota bacterium]